MLFFLLLAVCTLSVSSADQSVVESFGLIERFDLRHGPLKLESSGGKDNYIEALGEQASIWGTSGRTLEAWAYPFKLVGNLTMEFSTDGGKTFEPVSGLLIGQTATPQAAQLHYADKRFKMTQTLFVPREMPGGAVLLDIDSSVDLQIAVGFNISLAPMLMNTKDKPEVRWDSKNKLLRAVEKDRKVELLVWSPLATLHETSSDGVERIVLRIPATTAKKGFVPIIIAASWPDAPPAEDTLSTMASQMKQLYAQSMEQYQRILNQAPVVSSPDEQVNNALSWSVISLHQLRVKNPFLGHGLVSGYAPSGNGTRAGYAWFFDEPTLTSWAYLRAGLASHVTEAFEFLLRYQRADGKMVHEITQSLPWYPDYFDKYKYAYIHASSGTYFLAACGNYYRQTGDIDFIRRNFGKLKKMLDWCASAVDPDDGLLRIGPKEWGSSESSFAVGKDTQMEGMWLCALRQMEYLAKAMDDSKLAERCRQMAQKAQASIEQKFWDEDLSSYLWGLDRAGRPLRSLVPHHSVSVWMRSLRPDRVEKMLQRMAHADFRTDWGLRSLAASDERYDPKGYQTGSVWPVWNAGAIIGDYRHNRQIDAYRNFKSMAGVRTIQALGPMPEVLNGAHCKILDGGVPHQMFAETAVQNAFYEGLLGLEIDIPASKLVLSPRMPSVWKTLSVRRIPLGSGRLDVQINNARKRYELTFDIKDKSCFSILLRPLLPAGCSIDKVLLDGKPADETIEVASSGTIVQLSISGCTGKHTLAIEYSGGFDFMPEDTPLKLGGPSRNLRLIKTEFKDKTWNLLVEGLAQTTYPLTFRTHLPPNRIVGGKLLDCRDGGVRIGLMSPPDATRFRDGFVRWLAQISWR